MKESLDNDSAGYISGAARCVKGIVGLLFLMGLVWWFMGLVCDACSQISEFWHHNISGCEAIFGERLWVNETRLKHQDAMRFNEELGYVREISPREKSEFFNQYFAYVLPKRNATYEIVGVSEYASYEDAYSAWRLIADVMSSKYGLHISHGDEYKDLCKTKVSWVFQSEYEDVILKLSLQHEEIRNRHYVSLRAISKSLYLSRVGDIREYHKKSL